MNSFQMVWYVMHVAAVMCAPGGKAKVAEDCFITTASVEII